MNPAINNLLAQIASQLDALEFEAQQAITPPASVQIVKAIKGNDRFKDSSVWLSLPSGRYLHIQSGKTTRASRLEGYVEPVYASVR
jgi:hypothetical protein